MYWTDREGGREGGRRQRSSEKITDTKVKGCGGRAK